MRKNQISAIGGKDYIIYSESIKINTEFSGATLKLPVNITFPERDYGRTLRLKIGDYIYWSTPEGSESLGPVGEFIGRIAKVSIPKFSKDKFYICFEYLYGRSVGDYGSVAFIGSETRLPHITKSTRWSHINSNSGYISSEFIRNVSKLTKKQYQAILEGIQKTGYQKMWEERNNLEE